MILYDVQSLHQLMMSNHVQPSGIVRAVTAWGKYLAGREDVKWIGGMTLANHTRMAEHREDFAWLNAANANQLAEGVPTKPRLIYEKCLLHPRDRSLKSRFLRKLGTTLQKHYVESWLEAILAHHALQGKRFIYHQPVNTILPKRIPEHCIPILNLYDLVPLVFTDSYTENEKSYFTQTIERGKEVGAHFIVNAEFTKHALFCRSGVSAERIHVLPLGSDAVDACLGMEASVSIQQITDLPYFLYVSSQVQRRKNVDSAIKAFQLWQQQYGQAARLIIVGKGSDALVKNLTSPDQQASIIGLGNISDADLDYLYQHALSSLYLSVYEGFGLPILEAMHRGLPVISSNVTSLPEVAGNAALLVNPFDLNEIASAMHAVFTNTALRNDLIAKGKQRALEFSWAKSCQALDSFYNQLLS